MNKKLMALKKQSNETGEWMNLCHCEKCKRLRKKINKMEKKK